jgi:hypothetical protein
MSRNETPTSSWKDWYMAICEDVTDKLSCSSSTACFTGASTSDMATTKSAYPILSTTESLTLVPERHQKEEQTTNGPSLPKKKIRLETINFSEDDDEGVSATRIDHVYGYSTSLKERRNSSFSKSSGYRDARSFDSLARSTDTDPVSASFERELPSFGTYKTAGDDSNGMSSYSQTFSPALASYLHRYKQRSPIQQQHDGYSKPPKQPYSLHQPTLSPQHEPTNTRPLSSWSPPAAREPITTNITPPTFLYLNPQQRE